MHLTMATLIVVLTAGGVSSQIGCPGVTEAVLENVIMENIPTEDSPQIPTVDVLNFHPVCLAYSKERDRYHFVSVVVEYTCKGNAQCPSGLAIEQFHSECVSGTWTGRVAGIGRNIRTINPTATISTPTREDCAFCFSPAVAISLGLTADPVTHCVACDSACSEGLMRCYDDDDTHCCQYYNADTCVSTCPSSRIPDNDYNCVCPSGYNCSQACASTLCVTCDYDPAICDVCADGYIMLDGECNDREMNSDSSDGSSIGSIIGITLSVTLVALVAVSMAMLTSVIILKKKTVWITRERRHNDDMWETL